MISLCEFLNTTNKNKFINLLDKEFGQYAYNITSNDNGEYNGWGKDIVVFEVDDYDMLHDKEELKRFITFCRKHNYVASFMSWESIFIEPIKSQEKISGKVVYHITTQDLYDRIISKKGLKCRGNSYRRWEGADLSLLNNPAIAHFGNDKHFNKKDSYRSITPRIYFVGTNNKDDIDTIAAQIGKLGEDDTVVLKIDLTKHSSIELYKDNANDKKVSAYYTLEDIPADIIKIDQELTEYVREN